MEKQTITITWGDRAENNVGMEMIGTAAAEGFSVADLKSYQYKFEKLGARCEFVDLVDSAKLPAEVEATSAALLIIRGGVDILLGSSATAALFEELSALEWDKKAKMKGRVVNKKARHNLCFSDNDQVAEYEAGKGTIVAYNKVPLLKQTKDRLGEILGDKAKGLVGEGNHYYDIEKCSIKFHGDFERTKVIALRVGAPFPLHYQWYQRSERIGEWMTFDLNGGDAYIMSEKAVGQDWKKKKIATLRHAAGPEKLVK